MEYTFVVENPELYVGILAIGGFIGFWVGIMYLMAYAGGWRNAAELYGMMEGDSFPDDKITYGSLQVGSSSYNNSMSIAINTMGIYLRPIWMFRAGHKALFIPWGAVYEVTKNPLSAGLQQMQSAVVSGNVAQSALRLGKVLQGVGLFTDSYKIVVGNPSVLSFVVSGTAARRWKEILESQLTKSI